MLPILLPTYEDVRQFLEYTNGEEENWKNQLDALQSQRRQALSNNDHLPPFSK